MTAPDLAQRSRAAVWHPCTQMARLAQVPPLPIARGEGPAHWLAMLGYAGWGPGQLEAELTQNGWLVCDATPDLVFETPDLGKWEAALNSMGIPAHLLSAEGGSA